MANSYTQLYIQFVFAVNRRVCLIQPDWEIELHKYITGILKNHQHKPIAINGMPDHIHVFIGLNPNQAISDLMRIVKGDSSEWINKRGFTRSRFSWQEGYGAFSYRQRDVHQVYQYILNQKVHHSKQTFMEEYTATLREFEVDYDPRYILKEPI